MPSPIDSTATSVIPRVPAGTGEFAVRPVSACPVLRHPGAARILMSWAWACAFVTLAVWSAALVRVVMLLWAWR